MDRAQLVATAFIGIVFATNSFGPAHGQTPSRFIVQPQKANQPVAREPAAPTGATADSYTNGPADSPANRQSLALTSPEARRTVNSKNAPFSQPANQTATNATNATNIESLIATPSLSQASPSNTTLDSLNSLATVPSIEFEEQVERFAAQGQRLNDAASRGVPATGSHPRVGRAVAGAPSASGGLQWISRATSNRSPVQATDSQSNAVQPVGDFNSSSNRTTWSSNAPLYSNSSSTSFNQFNPSIQSNTSATDWRAVQAANEQAAANNQLLTQIAHRVGAIETKIDKADEPAERNRVRAALVSSQITNDPRFASAGSEPLSVGRLESPQGWQAIGQRLTNHVTRCESLLRRGAFCSAREEGESACLLLLRHIDLIDNLYRCEPAWLAANQSLREAEDFLAVQRMSDSDGLRRLIDSHHTPILKAKNLSEMSPLTAAQHYRVYAEMQLLEATQGHPWASELLYAVGRTYQAEADATPVQVDVLRMRSIAFYRASRTTLPSNAVACNQLGYLLLQMDRNEEAREVLAAAVSLKNDPAFLNNFAEASRRLGDSQSFAWAAQMVAAIRSRTPAQSPTPQFLEVTPEEFVAISPRAIGPQAVGENANSAPFAVTAPAYKSATAPRSMQSR